MPYLGLYLESVGMQAAQVGFVFAVMQGTKIVSPSLWAWWSRRLSNRMKLVRTASLVTLLCFSVYLFETNFWPIVLATFAFSFFWNAMLPQFESVTLTKLGQNAHAYSNIRLWGSVGFIGAVLGIGLALREYQLQLWPWLIALSLLFIFISSLTLNENGRQIEGQVQHSIRALLKQKHILAFFAVVFFIQASHGPYYAFFSIHLDRLGYNEAEIGQLWALGVIAEIVLFLAIQRVFKHVSLRKVLLVSLILTTLRWLCVAWLSDKTVVLVMTQLLHAASFGALHAVCIQLTHQYFVGKNQDAGQALYSSVGYGAGGMVGGLLAGYMWDGLGATYVFAMAALFSFLGYLMAWKWVATSSDPLKMEADGVSSV